MNYLSHINYLFSRFMTDVHFTPSHLALYVCIISKYNKSRFKSPIRFCSNELQKQSKIKSRRKYYKILKDLEGFDLLEVSFSKNYFTGTLIRIKQVENNPESISPHNREISPDTIEIFPVTNFSLNKSTAKRSVRYNEVDPNSITQAMVSDFFLTQNSSKDSAIRFYNHYKSTGWITVNNVKIVDWQAAALKWISYDHRIYQEKHLRQKHNPHQLVLKKRYDEPI